MKHHGPGVARTFRKTIAVSHALSVSVTFVCSVVNLVCYSGPEIPPSLRMRQKWMAIRTVTMTGMKTQWRT